MLEVTDLTTIVADVNTLVGKAELDDIYGLAATEVDTAELLQIIEGGYQVTRALMRQVWDNLPAPDDTERYQVERANYWAGLSQPADDAQSLQRAVVLRSVIRFFKKHLPEADEGALVTLAMLTVSGAEGAYLAGEGDTFEAAKGLMKGIGLS